MNWSSKVNKSNAKLRLVLFFCGCIPFIFLTKNYFYDELGINPFATLSHLTGNLALFFLLVTLAITPFRKWFCSIAIWLKLEDGKRLADWNFLIKMRRQLGLFSFFYGLLHFLIYLLFDIDLQWQFFQEDFVERPFVLIGLLNLILLFLLSITSPSFVRKKMGRWWRRVHRLIYIMVPLAILHYWWSAKWGDSWPLIAGVICGLLMAHRFWFGIVKRKKSNDDGMEAIRK